jgi:hypothetical protein
VQIISSSGASKTIFAPRIFPLYRHHFTDVVFSGVISPQQAENLILHLDLMPKLEYMSITSPRCSSTDIFDLDFSPFAQLDFKFTPKEQPRVTALRAALQRVKYLSIDKLESINDIGCILVAAPNLESLALRAGKKGNVELVVYSGMRQMLSLKSLTLDQRFTAQLLDWFSSDDDGWPAWPLECLSFAIDPEYVWMDHVVDLLTFVSSTLRKLHVTSSAPFEADAVTPLFSAPLPHLSHLTLVNALSTFLPCTSFTPRLTSLRIFLDPADASACSFFDTLPTFLDSLPSLRTFSFDFSPSSTNVNSLRLDAAATTRLTELCKDRNIVFRSRRRFRPFGAKRNELLFFGLDGSTTANGDDVFIEEKTDALDKAVGEVSAMIAKARAEKNGELVNWLLGFFDRLG